MIVVAVPSRGLIHSRTMDDVLANVEGYKNHFVFAHGENIPDSHNSVIEQARELQPDYIWLVEDDMHLPAGTLFTMLEEIEGHEIVVCDYPCGVDKPTVFYLGGEFAYAALGCVLIRPEALDKLMPPVFRTDTSYQIQDDQLIPSPSRGQPHGLLDVDFWVRVKEANIDFVVSKKKVGHYYLKSPQIPKTGNHTGKMYQVDTWLL